jgi:hypothetical protein
MKFTGRVRNDPAFSFIKTFNSCLSRLKLWIDRPVIIANTNLKKIMPALGTKNAPFAFSFRFKVSFRYSNSPSTTKKVTVLARNIQFFLLPDFS